MPSQPPIGAAASPASLAAARRLSGAGDVRLAEAAWRQVLEAAPQHPEAWYRLGWLALSQGHYPEARDHLRKAAAAAPRIAAVHVALARACRLDGRPDQALAALEHAVAADPADGTLRFEQAELLAQLGRRRAAAMVYQLAISLTPPARRQAPETRALLARAQDFLAGVRGELGEHLRAHLAPLQHQADANERRRFEDCLAILEGRRSFATQHPATLAYPRLPPIPFFERDEFEWAPALEAAFPLILEELHDVLAQPDGFEPYLQGAPGLPPGGFGALDHTPDWGAYFLWKHGRRIDAHCQRCPHTQAALAATPQVHIPERAPVSFFSALKPRTHIPPHFGATNTRLTVHLPLLVPEDCALRVGGEVRTWTPGEVLVFDDTFEHEAWNRGRGLRVVLIFDVWNPLLSPLERELITQTVGGLLDFYRGQSDLGEL